MARVPVGADADLNASGWVSGAAKVKSSAVEAQGAIDNLVKSLKEAQALAGLSGTTSVKATVDTSDIEQAVSLRSLLEDPTSFVASTDESDIEAAVNVQNELNENTDFVASANDSDINAAVDLHNELETNTSFTASVSDSELDTAKDKHDDLETNTSFTASVTDSELDTAKRKHDDLGRFVSTKVNVDDSEVQSLLSDIRSLQTIQVGLEVAGGATGAVGGIAGVFAAPVAGIIEMDTAIKRLEGTTGNAIPEARELIVDLYTNAWGESKTEIAEVIGLAQRLGIAEKDIAEAVTTAFEISSVTGEEAEKSITTLETMVRTGLAGTYSEAGDIVAGAFQGGMDRGEDMMDTFVEYSPNFATLGLTGKQAANAIIGGIEGGFMNADYAADSLRELSIRIGTDFNEEIQKVLSDIGMLDEAVMFREGKLGGAELIAGLIQGIEALPADQQPAAAAALFGTTAEDFTIDAIKGLNPLVDHIGNIDGRLDAASTAVNSDLGTAFTILKRNVSTEFENFLQDTFDIEGLIEDLTTAINTFFANLGEGENIFGAAEDAFGLGGLEETMQTIQRIFGEIGIAILQVMADIAEFFNQDSIAEDIRGVVAEISEIQLGADLFAADDQQQLADSMKRALDRGVSEADIGQEIIAQFEALRDSGDLTGALNLLDTIAGTEGLQLFNLELMREQVVSDINQVVNEALASGDLVTAFQNAPTEAIQESIRQSMAGALADGARNGFADAESALQAIDYASILNPAATGIHSVMGLIGSEATAAMMEGLLNDFDAAMAAGDLDLAGRIAASMDDAALQAQVDEMRASIETIADSSDETAQEFGTDTEAIASDMDSARSGIDQSVAGSILRMVALGVGSMVMQTTIGQKLSDMATDWVDTSGVVGDETEKMSTDFEDGAGKMGETHTKVRDDLTTTSDHFGTTEESMSAGFTAMTDSITADSQRLSDGFLMMQDELALWREISVTEFVVVGDEFSRMVDRFQVNAERLGGIIDNIVADFADAGTLSLPVSVSGGGGGSNVTNNNSVTNNNNVAVTTNNGATVAAATRQVSQGLRNS